MTVLWRNKWESRDADVKLAVRKDTPAGKSDIKNKLIIRRAYLALRRIYAALAVCAAGRDNCFTRYDK